MSAAKALELISVKEYLAGESTSDVRHEYLGGVVYTMAVASEAHNAISLNLTAALRSHLRGKACQVFMADFKVRLNIASEEDFYYPDVMVACDPRDTHRHYKSSPKVLIEVLSPDTERIDQWEKLLSYTQIETLEEFVLVAQDRMEATVFRRADNWLREVVRQADQALRLASLEFTLPLRDVYAGVKV